MSNNYIDSTCKGKTIQSHKLYDFALFNQNDHKCYR